LKAFYEVFFVSLKRAATGRQLGLLNG